MSSVSLHPSRILAAFLLLSHFFALIPAVIYLHPPGLKLPAAMFIAYSAFHLIRLHAWLAHPQALIRFDIDESGCKVMQKNGQWLDCQLLGSSFLTARLTVLNLRCAGRLRTRSLLILPDAIDAEEYRQLRVRLKWQA